MFHWDHKFQTKYGQIRIYLTVTYVSLVLKLLFMYLKMRDQSLMQKLKHVCFLVMAKMSLVIDYMIQLTKKLIRSRDVVFVEDQTIAYIEKIDEPESKHSDILIDLSSTSLT